MSIPKINHFKNIPFVVVNMDVILNWQKLHPIEKNTLFFLFLQVPEQCGRIGLIPGK